MCWPPMSSRVVLGSVADFFASKKHQLGILIDRYTECNQARMVKEQVFELMGVGYCSAGRSN